MHNQFSSKERRFVSLVSWAAHWPTDRNTLDERRTHRRGTLRRTNWPLIVRRWFNDNSVVIGVVIRKTARSSAAHAVGCHARRSFQSIASCSSREAAHTLRPSSIVDNKPRVLTATINAARDDSKNTRDLPTARALLPPSQVITPCFTSLRDEHVTTTRQGRWCIDAVPSRKMIASRSNANDTIRHRIKKKKKLRARSQTRKVFKWLYAKNMSIVDSWFESFLSTSFTSRLQLPEAMRRTALQLLASLLANEDDLRMTWTRTNRITNQQFTYVLTPYDVISFFTAWEKTEAVKTKQRSLFNVRVMQTNWELKCCVIGTLSMKYKSSRKTFGWMLTRMCHLFFLFFLMFLNAVVVVFSRGLFCLTYSLHTHDCCLPIYSPHCQQLHAWSGIATGAICRTSSSTGRFGDWSRASWQTTSTALPLRGRFRPTPRHLAAAEAVELFQLMNAEDLANDCCVTIGGCQHRKTSIETGRKTWRLVPLNDNLRVGVRVQQ